MWIEFTCSTVGLRLDQSMIQHNVNFRLCGSKLGPRLMGHEWPNPMCGLT